MSNVIRWNLILFLWTVFGRKSGHDVRGFVMSMTSLMWKRVVLMHFEVFWQRCVKGASTTVTTCPSAYPRAPSPSFAPAWPTFTEMDSTASVPLIFCKFLSKPEIFDFFSRLRSVVGLRIELGFESLKSPVWVIVHIYSTCAHWMEFSRWRNCISSGSEYATSRWWRRSLLLRLTFGPATWRILESWCGFTWSTLYTSRRRWKCCRRVLAWEKSQIQEVFHTKTYIRNTLNFWVLANLNSSSMYVQVCDLGQCRNCSGGARDVFFEGFSGWNYVVCDLIGSTVSLVHAPGQHIVRLCELDLIGQNGNL